MTHVSAPVEVAERLQYLMVPPSAPVSDVEEDVRCGLLARPKSLPPKYFYDERGSQLFDRICDTAEYYPTRTEDALLRRYAAEIMDQVDPVHILEFGSGTSRKTRHLFRASDSDGALDTYVPFDVCKEMLLETGRSLTTEYDWLNIYAMVGDYHAGLANLPGVDGPRLVVFLGGTIGNFTQEQAIEFLQEVRGTMRTCDWLLLGADRVKDLDVLNAAYNDSDGITAKFNLNVLNVLNQQIGADFQESGFRHEAYFNAAASQIEMYLVAAHAQTVNLGSVGASIEFSAGERILTEISRKFTRSDLETLLVASGFAVRRHYEPQNGYFSLVLAQPV